MKRPMQHVSSIHRSHEESSRPDAEPNSAVDRRRFLQTAVAAAAAGGLAKALPAAEAVGQRRLKEIGIIGGVPKDAAGDWQTSLRRMAAIGYTYLEGGLRGDSPEAYLKFLKEIGLTLISCGAKFGKKLPAGWLDSAVALKARYATVFWPWFYSTATMTLAQLDEIAAQLNKAGREAADAGLRLAVHNHDKEFQPLEGKPIFDRLLEQLDPKLVTVEMDLYWVVKGGADPVDYFKRYPGRFELFHYKDMGRDAERSIVPVGDGTIDFARILAHSEPSGVKYHIVEPEGAANTMKGAEDSYRHLSKLRY